MAISYLTLRISRGTARAVLASACLCLNVAAADKNYTVKRNDTLTDLAHKNGLSVSELAERNGLTTTERLRVGQKLLIPDAETGVGDPGPNSRLPKGLNVIHLEAGKWKYIVIHHSASPNASVKGMDYYHRVERH